jgi:hypothetical protein
MLKAKYGFVVLVDALGTKTDTIESSLHYLKVIDAIKSQVQFAHQANLEVGLFKQKVFKSLSIRFFGDTIMITYQVKKKNLEYEYFDNLSFILRGFICRALELGILFRGSISLCEYIDKGNIVLGPAVFDAAAWYDKLDMVGIIATPKTTASLKSIFLQKEKKPFPSWIDAVLDTHPLKIANSIETFALNWPHHLNYNKAQEETAEAFFYRLVRAFPMPFGTESKYHNTERFFQKCYQSDQWKRIEDVEQQKPDEARN